MRLSLIVLSFCRAALLKHTLPKWVEQRPGFAHEILVMNDGPADDTHAVVAESKRPVRYLHTGERNRDGLKWRGMAFAANIGAKRAAGDILAITAGEIYPCGPLLAEAEAAIGDYEDCWAVSGFVIDDQGSILNELNRGGAPILDPSAWPQYETTAGFFIAMRRSMFISLGGYDEDFTGSEYEDTDLIMRLRDSGRREIFLPSGCIHLFHSRPRQASAEYTNLVNHNANLYTKRRGQLVRNVDRSWGLWDGKEEVFGNA